MSEHRVIWDGTDSKPLGRLLFGPEPAPVEPVEPLRRRRAVPLRVIVESALQAGPQTQREIAAALGFTNQEINNGLYNAIKAGTVVIVGTRPIEGRRHYGRHHEQVYGLVK